FQQLHATVAVAPFVVVPTDDFHEAVAKQKRQLAVENAGMGISDDVLGNERLIAVFDDALVAFVRRSFFKSGVDGLDRRILFEHSGEIGDRTIRSWHTESAAI